MKREHSDCVAGTAAPESRDSAIVLEDVKRRRIRVPNTEVEIALLDWGGTGPLALLHHANGFCAAVWEPVALALRDRFRVVALDARGHGDSTAPPEESTYRWELFGADVVAVARALATEHAEGRVALALGHSFGGVAMLTAAAQSPALFERMILLDPVIHLRPDSPLAYLTPHRGQSLADRARKRRSVWPSRDAVRARWMEKELFENWDPEVLALFLAEGLRDLPDGQVELKCRPDVEAMIFEASGGFDPWALAPSVTVPTRILRAARGEFLLAAYDELAILLANASVGEVEAGHLIPMECPDLVVEVVESFIDAYPIA
jgi:pimeloyl-ACP methyl ester carboxylesterase